MKTNNLIPLLALAACTASSESTAPTLDLDTNDANHVGGTYTADGVTVAFDFSRDQDLHRFEFRASDGSPLITTTLEGAEQTMHVLGDRLVVSGIANAPDPTLVGDESAMDDLQERPEAALLDGLRDALADAGVDSEVYAPEPPKVSNLYDRGNGYYRFFPGDWKTWLSAAGAWPTYIYLQNPTGRCALVDVMNMTTWDGPFLAVDPYGKRNHTVYWWGALMRIRNVDYSAWFEGRTCGGATVDIRVSPYTWSP
jgi:hypothetical protein